MKHLPAIFLLFLSLHADGQAQRAMNPDEVAGRLKFYQEIQRLKSPFSQTKRVKDMGLEVKSSGEMELVRPQKVVWTVLKPGRLELVVDGLEVTQVSGTGKERLVESWTMSGSKSGAVSRGFLGLVAWLRMDVPAIVAAYDFIRQGEGTYRCVPKDPKTGFFGGLTITLHPKGHVKRLVLEERSGDSIDIAFGDPVVTYRR